MLHVAPEQPYLKRFKSLKNLDYTTADLDSPIADIHLDVMKMDIPDNTYDVVICNHVLEHVKDANVAMREILRVLKPGGWAILLVPIRMDVDTNEDPSVTDPKERQRLYGQYDHVRQFGRDYTDYIAKAGFTPFADDITIRWVTKHRQCVWHVPARSLSTEDGRNPSIVLTTVKYSYFNTTQNTSCMGIVTFMDLAVVPQSL